VRRFAAFFGVWMALAGAGGGGWAVETVAAGLAAATAVSRRLLPPTGRRRIHLWPLAASLPHFLWRSLVGGVDVAWRALHPRMPLHPGWMVYSTRLSAGGRAALGGEFSLLPGSLVAGGGDGRLFVHMLDLGPDAAARLAGEEQRVAAVVDEEAEAGPGDGEDQGR
jgi:multicomponent Na+:H+ antiporter subunit E